MEVERVAPGAARSTSIQKNREGGLALNNVLLKERS